MGNNNFFDRVGKIALGSRLRMFSERITEDAARLYKAYGVDIQPKWFPVFYVLSKSDGLTITDISQEIMHSHPSVSKIVREMAGRGLVTEKKGRLDKRKNIVRLSKKGRAILPKIEQQYLDVNHVLEDTFTQVQHNLWKAMDEMEYLLDQKSLYHRVMASKKEREAQHVEVVDFSPKYRKVFKELNIEWIKKYFKVEPADLKTLDHPQKNIINKGGYIKIALYKKEPVGVCALVPIRVAEYDFELAKMAVSPKAQGLGIGWILGQSIIGQARKIGCKKLFLESNTILTPAIRLYEKMGFKKVMGYASPYERSNIQMELLINDK